MNFTFKFKFRDQKYILRNNNKVNMEKKALEINRYLG